MGLNIWTAVHGIGQYFAENANSRQKRICARRGPMRRAAVYWLAAAMASIDRAGSLSQADKNEHHVSRWLIISSLLPVVMQIELIQVKSHFSINVNEFFIKYQLKLYESIALWMFYNLSFECATIGWRVRSWIHENVGSRRHFSTSPWLWRWFAANGLFGSNRTQKTFHSAFKELSNGVLAFEIRP